MYYQQLNYFNYQFDDMELMQKFEEYILTNVNEIFTDAEFFTKKLRVTYTEARSVVNDTGSYRTTLQAIVNTLNMQANNKSKYKEMHESLILAVNLYETNTFQGLMNKLRKYLSELVQYGYQWNVVYYTNYFERSASIG